LQDNVASVNVVLWDTMRSVKLADDDLASPRLGDSRLVGTVLPWPES